MAGSLFSAGALSFDSIDGVYAARPCMQRLATGDWLPRPIHLATAAHLRIINERFKEIVYIFSKSHIRRGA